MKKKAQYILLARELTELLLDDISEMVVDTIAYALLLKLSRRAA